MEVAGRAQRAYARRLRVAHLPASKSLESFDFAFQPTLSARVVQELATISFVQAGANAVLLGPPGVANSP
jgi:DNA replication protein DnaC